VANGNCKRGFKKDWGPEGSRVSLGEKLFKESKRGVVGRREKVQEVRGTRWGGKVKDKTHTGEPGGAENNE